MARALVTTRNGSWTCAWNAEWADHFATLCSAFELRQVLTTARSKAACQWFVTAPMCLTRCACSGKGAFDRAALRGGFIATLVAAWAGAAGALICARARRVAARREGALEEATCSGAFGRIRLGASTGRTACAGDCYWVAGCGLAGRFKAFI